MNGAKSYDALRLIGASLVPVLRDLAPNVRATDDELEGLAAELVVELARHGFSIIPKEDYDALIIASQPRPASALCWCGEPATVKP